MIYSIYKILCDDLPDFIYVGSTQAFRQRKWEHKSMCNNEKSKLHNIKLYNTIRNNGGWENWRMVCIAEIEVDTKRQAEIIEEEYRLKLNGNLNSHRCYRTEEQRLERDRERCKEYYENNKEKLKDYYETNKEHIKETTKTYRDNNKEQRNKKFNCECGGKYTFSNKSQHEKSIIHKNYIENNKN
jgi:hypothetical protein